MYHLTHSSMMSSGNRSRLITLLAPFMIVVTFATNHRTVVWLVRQTNTHRITNLDLPPIHSVNGPKTLMEYGFFDANG